jgi:hypothetical protein
MTGVSHARPSLRSGLPWDSRSAATDINVNNTGQLTCYEKRTFSLASDTRKVQFAASFVSA